MSDITAFKNIPIEKIIGVFLHIKKVGINYAASCPFHHEKTPSFIISPQKNIFRCFGCGESGDGITFIQKIKEVSFLEALEILAEMFAIPFIKNAKNTTKEALEILENVNKFYKKTLLENKPLLQYCKERGLDGEDLEKYDIGWAASARELKENFSEKELLLAGVFVNYEYGAAYPARWRITFGIRNQSHKIVAFVCRLHNLANFKQGSPKYINSKESIIYQKRELLYMFSNAKTSIKNTGKALVIEGYIDCITHHKIGNTHCVATGGTAFSVGHLNLLLRYTPEVKIYFCFDNDKSGMEANFRALKVCYEAGFYNVKILLLKNTLNNILLKDINEVIQAGLEPIYKEIEGFEFFVKMQYKKMPRDKAFNEIKTFLKNISNYHIKAEFSNIFLSLTNAPKESLQINKTIESHTYPLPREVLKTLIISERAREVYRQYFGDEIKDRILQEIYTKKIDKLKEILIDSDITPLENRDFDLFIYAKKIQDIKKMQQQAARDKNMNLILSLNKEVVKIEKKIKALNNPQKGVFIPLTEKEALEKYKDRKIIGEVHL